MDKTSPPTAGPPSSGAPEGLELTGKTLGDFKLLRCLGQGGMGQVYLAEQISLKRKVALKILKPELASNPTALQRFKTEAEAVARATHSNIVQVYFIGEENGVHFMALEYVEGRNLREFLARKGPPELPLAVSIMRQVAAALQRASELGIVHRDIKPENILLTRKGEVKVADFGLSRCLDGTQPALNLTQSGVTMGTPLYMSPEQVEGKQLDCRTDIYSFGVSCYHMLAGHPPFQGSTAFEVALQHVRSHPPPLASVRPDLPDLLCAIVHKMMARDPAQRYQTGRELLKDLTRLREGLSGITAAVVAARDLSVELVPIHATGSLPMVEPLTSGAATTVEPPPPPRRGWLWGAFGFSVLLALVCGAGSSWLGRQGRAAGTDKKEPKGEANKEASEEQALRKLIDKYLDPDKEGPPRDANFGFRLCQELGVLYLSQNRLDEAKSFFSRLEKSSGLPRFPLLGKIGRGIVLALRQTPATAKESNALFRELFIRSEAERTQNIVRFLQALRTDGERAEEAARILQALQPGFREYVVKAVKANLSQGVVEKDMPATLTLSALARISPARGGK